MNKVTIASILLASILTNNMVLSKFLGICPFLGVSKKTNTAFSMSVAVILVMVLSTAVTHPIYTYILAPKYVYLETIVFILVIAAIVQLLEIVLKKFLPPIYKSLGIYLPLITTNCAILGAALLCIQNNYNLLESVIFSFGSAVGWTLAIIIFAGVRARVVFADTPKCFKGTPIALVTACLIAMAFAGFQGVELPL